MQETNTGCQYCKKVFLKQINGDPGFITRDNFDNVKMEDIEFLNYEFHHLNEKEQEFVFGKIIGKKKKGVSAMGGYAMQKEEAQKCLLVCIKCHCRATQQSYKGVARQQHRSKKDYVIAKKKEIGECAECHEKTDENNIMYMEFDHIDPETKLSSISDMVLEPDSTYYLDELALEISKCRMVCRFCHKRRSMKQRAERHANKRRNRQNQIMTKPQYTNK